MNTARSATNNSFSDNGIIALLRLDPNSRAPRNANTKAF